MSTRTYGSVGSSAGNAIGMYFGGPLGGALGSVVGGYIGNSIGNSVNGPLKLKGRVGARLADLSVQGSAYGEMIPVVYGSARIAGNVIWALPIKEVETVTQNSASGGKGGGQNKATRADTTFSYFATLAIAICEGEIDELLRVWADAKIINQADYNIRFYKGTEEQTPDSLIESLEGFGKTPAYLGLAYVVIEDFPLADYGNRIPNFTFEINKTMNVAASKEQPVEDMIKSMVMIPGAGEFVYDDIVQSKIPGESVGDNWVQRGNARRINQNNRNGKADGLVALGQLAKTCKNLEWIAPVVCWFGDNLNAGSCTIKPGVEYQNGAITSPDIWMAAGYTRATARQITLIGGSPQYGGTPSDASLLRYLQELKNRGYKIMYYPMIFMDVANKPWRGRITGDANDASIFFTKTNGYNEFIIHYANLVKNVADAFVIGSELIGLTSINNGNNVFPAVNELISLAARVKNIVGANVKVTYAADWSEYHHTNGGWYNLDALWASPNIDMVGIDAYFPLTNSAEPVAGFTQKEIMDCWNDGEGYNWYYSDIERTIKQELSPAYAWKNIEWWWNNYHINPDSSQTAWVPNSKKIWFTEYGFPSVDGCTNQPNVFYDPNSLESHFPYHSHGRVDFRAQRNAITATEKQWADSAMVERKFLWTWDARPFPFWPDLTNIWADGNLWRYGHWVQGKFGASSLAAIVTDLSKRAGLNDSQIDVSHLTDIVEGYILKTQGTVREALENLRAAYFFDAVESGGIIRYIKRNGFNITDIAENELISADADSKNITITRIQEFELPQKVDVVYLDKSADYQSGNQHSQRLAVSSQISETIGLPIVMSAQYAKIIADISLYNSWKERSHYEFALPLRYIYLEPTDVININLSGVNHVVRITETKFTSPGIIKIKAVAEDASVYNFYNEPGQSAPQTIILGEPGNSVMAILDLPPMPSDIAGQAYIRYAACGVEEGWHGAVIFNSNDAGANYNQVANINSAAFMGVALDVLGDASCDIFDYKNTVTISLYGGELEGISQLAVLNGGNVAKLGDEIFQFQTATLLAEDKYQLSGLLRGRLGTEWATATHIAGEGFILINNNIIKEAVPNSAIGISKLYKAVSVGKSLEDAPAMSFTYNANALKPFSPVHIKFVPDAAGNIKISWVRRMRIDGQWRDNVDVPLGELSEKYEIDVINGSNVVRTINSTSSSAIYSIADQLTDFGFAQNNINIKVYQISDAVGRGVGVTR